MKSPLQAFVDWFQTLPPDHRKEVAAFMIVSGPEYGELQPSHYEQPEPLFLEHIRRIADDRLREVGTALTLRARIDYFFVNNRGTRGDWDLTQDRNERILSRLEHEGDSPRLYDIMDKMQRELPLRREQWLVTMEKWKGLCDSELSDEALDAWWSPRPTA